MKKHDRFIRIVKLFVTASVLVTTSPAYSQDDVQRITTACQASLRELSFWCVTVAAAEQSVVPPVERENNCAAAKKRIDGYCYPLEVRQLGCTSALHEMEVWCGGNAKLTLTDMVNFCEDSRRNVRLFCY